MTRSSSSTAHRAAAAGRSPSAPPADVRSEARASRDRTKVDREHHRRRVLQGVTLKRRHKPNLAVRLLRSFACDDASLRPTVGLCVRKHCVWAD